MTGQQRFKALLFDFDETLVLEYEASDAAVDELLKEIKQLHPTENDLRSTLRSTANRVINESPMGAVTVKAFGPYSELWAADELMWDDKEPLAGLDPQLGEFRRQVWDDALKAVGIADTGLAHQMAERLPALTHEKKVPYPDAESVLSALGQRHPMVILTNGTPEIQALKVERSGLKHHFDHVVLCHEHGGKPDPKPFQVALELLGCEPTEVAMVGNSLATDIAGARNAGIFSVWVNRSCSNESPADEKRPDVTVRHLSELLDLL